MTSLPMQFMANVTTTFMPSVIAQIDELSTQTYLIDNNAALNLFWTTTCQQSSSLAIDQSQLNCSDAPSLVIESLDLTQVTVNQPYDYYLSGGYTTSGQNITVDLSMTAFNNQIQSVNSTFSYAANLISGDAWQYNVPQQSGALGFGPGSDIIYQQKTDTYQVVQWSIEIGNVADQSFAGANYLGSNQSNLYIGPGNYTESIFTGNEGNSFTLYTTEQNTYSLSKSWFGQNITDSTTGFYNDYYTQLGYSESSVECSIALNYQGLGLPWYEWNQVVNLLYRTSQAVANDLTCISGNGGMCSLAQPCSTVAYTELWSYFFKFQFDINVPMYTTVQFGSFAINNAETGTCDLYIQLLNPENAASNNYVLGSMWLQNFIALFTSDFTNLTPKYSLQLMVSPQFGLPGASIDSVTPAQNESSPFYNLNVPQNITINVNKTTMTATIQADLGYQGEASFLISLTNELVLTYAQDCQTVGVGQVVCSAEPNFATNYWNTNQGISLYSDNVSVDGYETFGNFYNQSLCITSNSNDLFCSVDNQGFYAVQTIMQNNWNYASPGAAGIIGLGAASPIWNLTNAPGNKVFEYSIQFSNVTDWTFANSSYKPTTYGNSVALGSQNYAPYVGQPTIVLKPTTEKSQLFSLEQFSFGITYNDTTESYQSIINGDQDIYGFYANTVKITLSFRGVGLPTTSYNKFVSLIDIISSGQANCAKTKGGYCVLPKSCSNYQNLWSYSFKIVFVGDLNYLVVPFASFVSEQTIDGEQVCAIYVEMLEETNVDSKQIVLGQMFFQSVAYMQQMGEGVTFQMTLVKNINALSSTYLGSEVKQESSNDAFQIIPTTPTIDATTQINGLPSFSANLAGISSSNQYYFIDFTNDNSVVWDVNCLQNINGSAPCSSAPTYLQTQYSNLTAPIGVFNNQNFGGYNASGNLFVDQLCVGSNCKVFKVHSATNVTSDAWLYNQQGAFGTLGYGPNSSFWNQYINLTTGVATYSIALSGNPTYYASNVTFGSSGDYNSYQSFNSIIISTDFSSSSSYGLTQFGFGQVYQNSNGMDVSSYFQNLTTAYPVQFNINFQGMGLPSDLFTSYASLLQNITDNTSTCTASNDGVCVLPNACESYAQLENFSFQIQFQSNSTTYIRVPLAAFAESLQNQAGDNICQIQISYLDTQQAQSNIILGGMFFQQFFGVFNNYYNQTLGSSISQSVQLFIQINSNLTASYIGNEQLPTGLNPFSQMPNQFSSQVNGQFMPTVFAQFANFDVYNYLIDNNAMFSLVWTTQCQQSVTLATDSNLTACSDGPSFVTESLNLTQIGGGGPYSSTVSGGYTTSGDNLRSNLTMTPLGTNMYPTTEFVNFHAATEITGNSWLYNVSSPSGSIGLGAGSQFLAGQNNQTIQWSIEIGNVADQSFAGANYLGSNQSNFYMGPGNYTEQIFTGNENNSITLYTTEQNTYSLSNAWFGQNITNSDGLQDIYFTQLGYSQSSVECSIALNYQGLGLPWYEWNQVVNLLYRTNQVVANDLTCTSGNGGMCILSQSCNAGAYSGLWSYFFKFQFDIDVPLYTTVQLGSFAINNTETGTCDLYIQLLNPDDAASSNYVLGSMWLQNFIALFTTNVGGLTPETYLQLMVSPTYGLPGASIGYYPPVQNQQSPFFNISSTQNITFNVNNKTMTGTIKANIGFQGEANFQVSLINSFVSTYSQNCSTVGVGQVSCSASPNFATNYWNTSQGTPIEAYNITAGGYETQGNFYNQSLCLRSNSDDYLCSVGNQDFYVVNTIVNNNWNYESPADAGVIGLGIGSPVWNLTNQPGNNNFTFSIQFSNVTDWTFADPIYMPTTSGNSIALGAQNYQTYAGQPTINISPAVSSTYTFALTEFSFGTILNDTTQSYQSIINGDQTIYGTYTNITKITLDFRGLGLPTTSYNQFVSLIGIASNGQVNCAKTKNGYCVLPKSCSNYPNLWNYSFQIAFANTNNSNYLIVPLASFAAEQTVKGQQVCAIYVEMLKETDFDSKQIVLGLMFFQSVAFLQQMNARSGEVSLAVNINALQGTYIGNISRNDSADAFQINSTIVTPDAASSMNGLPTFGAVISGISSSTPYFFIDFTNDNTVVWDSSCVQTISGSGPCSGQPTNLVTDFSSTTQSTGTFTNKDFGGYITSGNLYLNEICLGSSCKFMQLYSASLITQNAWLYGQTGAYGILGYGPNSPFWNQYIDPISHTATYSITLSRSVPLEQNQLPSSTNSVTFGSGSIVNYEGQNSLTISTNDANGQTYAVSEFGFGLVYTNTDGTVVSSYFQNLTTAYPVQFNINFQGMGLPTDLFDSYAQLLQNVTNGQANCTSDSDGTCVLPSVCSSYTSLENYSFQIMFSSNSSDYIRVPLVSFATTDAATSTCNIQVSYLDVQQAQSSNIILGGMFFQQFYGIFNNTYNQTSGSIASQNVQLFVKYDTILNTSYIGNQQLPLGANPFYTAPTPNPPTPSNNKTDVVWIIILCIIIVLLAVFLGWAIFKWRQNAKQNEAKSIVYLNESAPLKNDFTEEI